MELGHQLVSSLRIVSINHGEAPVTAVFKTVSGFIPAGAIVAEANCWSMLKGGLTVNFSSLAQLYFESKNTSVEIWVDSIFLQPFTEEEWKSHQDQSIEKKYFPLGCAIEKNILTNQAYQNWFLSQFKYATFGNEMKWASTEYTVLM
ncbi:hypothetical protein ACFE04_017053 [Oxalis oulophora]